MYHSKAIILRTAGGKPAVHVHQYLCAPTCVSCFLTFDLWGQRLTTWWRELECRIIRRSKERELALGITSTMTALGIVVKRCVTRTCTWGASSWTGTTRITLALEEPLSTWIRTICGVLQSTSARHLRWISKYFRPKPRWRKRLHPHPHLSLHFIEQCWKKLIPMLHRKYQFELSSTRWDLYDDERKSEVKLLCKE